MRITAPAPGYNGRGPGGVQFTDGVGELDQSTAEARRRNSGALAYYREHGYGIGAGDSPAEPVVLVPDDPRELGEGGETVGSRLRDAAVDPSPEDYLAPINAGEPGELGNPYGPHVVSPGIHGGAGNAVPLLPGPVPPDPAEQEAKVAGATREVLVDGRLTTDVVAEVGERAEAELAAGDAPTVDAAAEQVQPPKHSARKADWVDHAALLGADRAEAEALTVPLLIERYDRPAPAPTA